MMILGPKLSATQRLLYTTLTRVAEDGLPCPSNIALAERLSLGSAAQAAHVMTALQNAALIIVQSGTGWRTVTIRATGATTPRLKPVASTRRPCLRCGRDFFSEGVHNRLCHPCNQAI